MRAIALISGGVFVLAAAQQVNLPAPLSRHFTTLAAAPSLTVVYTVQPIGEAKTAYKLVLSRPNEFLLTTPTGYVVSDGKMVTTYTTAKKSYVQESFSDAWIANFAKRPEVMAWSAFLVKDAAAEVTGAKAGAVRTVAGVSTTPVEVSFKKIALPATLYIDNKTGIARGVLLKKETGETLVNATSIELGKEPLAHEQFAFIAPAGSTKEEPVKGVTFAEVQTLMSERCMPCHSAQNMKAGLNLTIYAGIAAAVVPGKPADSLLIKSLHGVGASKMPKGRPSLSRDQIKLVETWILAGAKAE